jgi:hypothetical protein
MCIYINGIISETIEYFREIGVHPVKQTKQLYDDENPYHPEAYQYGQLETITCT